MHKREFYTKTFSFIFIFIFFAKMVITIAPFVMKHFDPEAVNAVIMQLEIENNEKGSDPSKEMVKEYLFASHSCNFLKPFRFLSATPFTDDEDDHLRTFYPSVPTPPPNC